MVTSAGAKPPPPALAAIALIAIGAGFAIAAVGAIGEALGMRLLIAPLGASAALIWAAPSNPLAQPRQVIGGYLLSAMVGVVVWSVLGSASWAIGVSVGLALGLVLATRTLHAPACALPVFIAFDQPAPMAMIVLTGAGATLLVGLAMGYHRYLAKAQYPSR